MRRIPPLLILPAIFACGSNAGVPDGADATVDASSCECSTLLAEQITRRDFTIRSGSGSVSGCDADQMLVGGGCVLPSTLDGTAALQEMGFWWDDPANWVCGWSNFAGGDGNVENTNTVVCVTESTAQDVGCSCDTIEQRIGRVEQAGTLAPSTFTRVASECRDGGILIGGSCNMEFSMFGDDNPIRLVSQGFSADGRWECWWNNPTEMWPVTRTGVATAVCLQPPSPGMVPEAEPLVDRIVQVQRTVELPSSNVHLDDVTCEAGNSLLWGACQLASPDISIRDVSTLRAGFLDPTQNRPDTWQCGWYNPTDLTPTATLTAVCLKPPSQ